MTVTSSTPQQSPASQEWDSNAQAKERFFRYFQHEVTALQEQMEKLSQTSIAGGERADAIDHCLAGIARLSHEVKDASSYVPAYDQRTYAEAIKALSDKFQNIRQSYAPRPKFTFKTAHKNPSAISLNDAAELAAQQRLYVPGFVGGSHSHSYTSTAESSFAPSPALPRSPVNEPTINEEKEAEEKGAREQQQLEEKEKQKQAENKQPEDTAAIRKPSFSNATSVSISSQQNLHIILPSSAAHATSSATLSHLRRCIVDLSTPTAHGGPFAGLTVRDVKRSLLVLGHVAGPAHITGVQDSAVVVCCRQFRMHECRGVDVYLWCGSRPVVEDVEGVRVAPVPGVYLPKSLESQKNLWGQVDDFKWLKQEPSPHWSVLPEEERTKEEVWKDVVPGGPGLGLVDILKAIGVDDGR